MLRKSEVANPEEIGDILAAFEAGKKAERDRARDSHVYPELEKPVDLVVHTKSPEKWLLVDRETGQIYVGNDRGAWDKLVPKLAE